MGKIELRKAKRTDIDTIRNIYWKLLDSSEDYASILQWKRIYILQIVTGWNT